MELSILRQVSPHTKYIIMNDSSTANAFNAIVLILLLHTYVKIGPLGPELIWHL